MTTIILNHTGKVEKSYSEMSISELAYTIKQDWRKAKGGVYFGAAPYIDAMMSLQSVTDKYINESGKSIVLYFLANAATWRGEVAKAIKLELKKRTK